MKIRIDKADSLFSKWIRTRDGWTCQRCLTKYPVGSQGLHNSHFYGRGHENTRFEPDNCQALCFGCHQYLGSNPNDHRDFMLKKLGQKRFDTLQLQANTYKKKDRAYEILKWNLALKDLAPSK